jgi:hypothetical protein
MYPAQAFFDGLYTENDLPDDLTINPYDLNSDQSVVVQRNGLIYGPHVFGPGYSQQVTIRETLFFAPEEGPNWVLEEAGEAGVGVLDSSPCMFFGPIPGYLLGAGPGGITDNFADTYTVTTNHGSGTVSRISLCIWTGTDELGCPLELRYDSRVSPPRPTSCKWTVKYAEGGLEPCDGATIAVKGPLQNTPVGSYGGGAVTVS